MLEDGYRKDIIKSTLNMSAKVMSVAHDIDVLASRDIEPNVFDTFSHHEAVGVPASSARADLQCPASPPSCFRKAGGHLAIGNIFCGSELRSGMFQDCAIFEDKLQSRMKWIGTWEYGCQIETPIGALRAEVLRQVLAL